MKDRFGKWRQIILHEFDDGSGADKMNGCLMPACNVYCRKLGISGFRSKACW